MITNLITLEDISLLARPCTADRDIADAFIAEAQRADIRPKLGDAAYLRLFAEDRTETENLLLEGGRWTDGDSQRLLVGIKTTLAYYALARILRDGSIQASRYGAVVKDSEYSDEAEGQEKNRQYRELFSQADAYMAEALAFVQSHSKEFPGYSCSAPSAVNSNRMRIKIIRKR